MAHVFDQIPRPHKSQGLFSSLNINVLLIQLSSHEPRSYLSWDCRVKGDRRHNVTLRSKLASMAAAKSVIRNYCKNKEHFNEKIAQK